MIWELWRHTVVPIRQRDCYRKTVVAPCLTVYTYQVHDAIPSVYVTVCSLLDKAYRRVCERREKRCIFDYLMCTASRPSIGKCISLRMLSDQSVLFVGVCLVPALMNTEFSKLPLYKLIDCRK